jgi:hypothetical protein
MFFGAELDDIFVSLEWLVFRTFILLVLVIWVVKFLRNELK